MQRPPKGASYDLQHGNGEKRVADVNGHRARRNKANNRQAGSRASGWMHLSYLSFPRVIYLKDVA